MTRNWFGRLALLAVLLATPAAAQDRPKRFTIWDIQLGEAAAVMLFGVDSVMRKQACLLDGKPWQCWAAAVHELQSLLDQGTVTCETVGEPDVYGRHLGRCAANGRSLNEELVRQGFAVARPSESSDYAGAEDDAKASKAGLWQGQFVRPSEFRSSAGILVERP